MTVKIAPSLLAADFASLAREVERAERAGADMLHLDVMDGHFVPNLTIGPALVKALRPHTSLYFDVHLMVENAHDFFESFCDAGADGLTVHLEVYPEPEAILEQIGALGKDRGLSINPDMPVGRLAGHLDRVDRVLIMSVFPGFGGQSFIEASVGRVREARELAGEAPLEIQVDGGVSAENAPRLIQAGADSLVAGTSTFRAADMNEAIQALRGTR